MKIKKAFILKKDKNDFIQKYLMGKLTSEVINNFLYTDNTNAELVEYESFLKKTTNGITNLNLLQMVKDCFAKKALKEEFGKRDFAIDDIKEKSIWIVEFNNSIFLVPHKNEIICNGNPSEEEVRNGIFFEKEFTLFCLNYAKNNIDKLNTKELEILEKSLNIFEPYKFPTSSSNRKKSFC